MTQKSEVKIDQAQARALWMRAQELIAPEPFGTGPEAVQRAIEHLGYVQIDTINVIERCHHHILFNRIPSYTRRDLELSQSQTKSVFEYWTHALSYVPTRDFRFSMKRMERYRRDPQGWFGSVTKEELARVIRLVKKEGPLSIRDIDNEVLVEKKHPWGSRKPSKKALELAFYSGQVVISKREGMLKNYEITSRHFGWDEDPSLKPKPASEKEISTYLVDRSLRSQGFVSLDSICYLNNPAKKDVSREIASRIKKGNLVELSIDGVEKFKFFIEPQALESADDAQGSLDSDRIHILSPFDPLIIQRKRLSALFGYEHKFEAYLPKEKRTFGYFTLPVLRGDKVVAVLDLKTDRAEKTLLVQAWHWTSTKNKTRENKKRIEESLGIFERFQLGGV